MATQQNSSKERTLSVANFHETLILAKWALSFFADGSFDRIRAAISRERLEGIDAESGQTHFFNELTAGTLFNLGKIPAEKFAEYDRNIVAHWTAITEKRNAESGNALRMKYFQWLSLLVTELYLDYFFNRNLELLADLNAAVSGFNAAGTGLPKLSPLKAENLNKVSYWMATGAGKTLLMHVNIRQYLHYAKREPSKIIVLTPNEGLTRQHLAELEQSGFFAAELREGELTSRAAGVHVVDAGKLISDEGKSKKGEKRMMAESFEGDNLVLVDEGHNGSTKGKDGERRRVREQICRDGFSFEYSATFGQAVIKNGKADNELRELYSKNILFDYSYKFFYGDGYGKEWNILNMPDDGNDSQLNAYLGASLLSFYQQRKFFDENAGTCARFGIEKPLCVFVGHEVNTDDSDVETVLLFLAKVLNEKAWCAELFGKLINNERVLTDKNGRNAFDQAFIALKNAEENGESVYASMLKRIFNTEVSARLKLRPVKDEILLYAGTSKKPFGIINVGEGKLLGNLKTKLAANPAAFPIDIEPEEAFSESQFGKINEKDSTISFLVGSKKFTEGWSSWRVSTMGLLNVGVSEGTQIIQLFGRGVRLKGENFSLKRSTPEQRGNTDFLRKSETLNIFGVRAAYMDEFRKYLEEEGLSTEKDILELRFSPRKTFPRGVKLKTLCLQDGYGLAQKKGFRAQETISLFEISEQIKREIKLPVAEYCDFSFVQSFASLQTGGNAGNAVSVPEAKLDFSAFPFFDWDKIYRRLMNYKAQQGYRNLELSKERLVEFCSKNNDWYRLQTRETDVKFDKFEKVAHIQSVFEKLLFNYTDKFYKTFQACYESKHMTTKYLSDDATGIPKEYVFEISADAADKNAWRERLEKLKKLVEEGGVPADFNRWSDGSFVAIAFERHLYLPLLYKMPTGANLPVKMKPLSFDAPSEYRFVSDLQAFYENPANADYFRNIDFYLMRNASSKSQGIGFAQAGNFYPDFLLWVFDKTSGKQVLAFVDPKGLRNLKSDSPKLNFSSEIKNLQETIRKESGEELILESFILSATPFEDLLWTGQTKEELEKRNILFLDDMSYMLKLFSRITPKN